MSTKDSLTFGKNNLIGLGALLTGNQIEKSFNWNFFFNFVIFYFFLFCVGVYKFLNSPNALPK